jgi:hypothetical protein
MFRLQVPRTGQKYLTRLHCSNVVMVGIEDIYMHDQCRASTPLPVVLPASAACKTWIRTEKRGDIGRRQKPFDWDMLYVFMGVT